MHFQGESYGGIYVPYIVQVIRAKNSALKIKSISLGDATFGNGAAQEYLTTVPYITQHPNNYLTKNIYVFPSVFFMKKS